MMQKTELIKKIKDYFNLNIYETKVWLALLSKGIASAGEIAEISGVPRSRTYDVLESLEKQGFAIAKVGKPTKYIVVKPTMVLEKIKRNISARADEKVKTLESLKGTKEYEELESLHNSSINMFKKEELSGAIKGRTNILSHARELLEAAEKEVVISMPASEFLEKSRIFSNLFDKLNKGSVKVKFALNGTEEEIAKVEAKHKVSVIKTNIKSKFFIIDRKQALFSLNNAANDEDELAVWLNSEFFSNAFACLFDSSRR